jgi:tetratricopeptide (TPR) repeat protein
MTSAPSRSPATFRRILLGGFFLLVVIAPQSIGAAAAADAFGQGVDAFKNKNYDLAIADFSEAVRLNPNLPQAYSKRGDAYVNKGDFDKAIADYSDALRLNPNDTMAYYNRGSSYFIKKILIRPSLTTMTPSGSIQILARLTGTAALPTS